MPTMLASEDRTFRATRSQTLVVHVAFLVEPVAAAAGRIDGQLSFQDARRLRPGHPP
jgi:hypothetical protein